MCDSGVVDNMAELTISTVANAIKEITGKIEHLGNASDVDLVKLGLDYLMHLSTACPGGTPPGHPGTLKKLDSNTTIPLPSPRKCGNKSAPPRGNLRKVGHNNFNFFSG